MKTRVVLTVDVEPSIAGAFDDLSAYPPLIHEPVWGEVAGKSEALGFMIRTLNRYGLEATFFVETMHTTWFPPETMGRYAAELASSGQDVQLHIHPVWRSFGKDDFFGADGVHDDCHKVGTERLVQLIEEGSDTIEAWTGGRPTAMRTGNFSTARNVFTAMRKAGLQYASNICTAMQRPPEDDLAVMGGAHEIEGIVELPVTCFADNGPVGRGGSRPLQITACSFTEIRALLNQLHAAGGAVAVIVTHPFEFLKRDDFRFANLRANRMVQSRFEQLCAFLAENADRFQTERLGSAARALNPSGTTPALTGSPINSVMRAVQNLVNDRIL